MAKEAKLPADSVEGPWSRDDLLIRHCCGTKKPIVKKISQQGLKKKSQ
jgi:hypothetical protein